MANGAKYNTSAIIRLARKGINGRPRKYDSIEKFIEWREEFFLECENEETKPTFTGYRQWILGTNDEKTFFERYSPDFEKEYMVGWTTIEQMYESIATDGATAGAIYILNNRRRTNWSNKQEIDVKSSDGSMGPAVFQGVGTEAAKNTDEE